MKRLLWRAQALAARPYEPRAGGLDSPRRHSRFVENHRKRVTLGARLIPRTRLPGHDLPSAQALNRADASRRETETQLRNQAELIDQAGEALIVRELSGAICSWNRGAEQLYGWTAEEAVNVGRERVAARSRPEPRIGGGVPRRVRAHSGRRAPRSSLDPRA